MEDTGTTFITISWTSTSVGSVNYTINTYSTDDEMISSNNTDDTNYTINGLISGTLYRINVVPNMGMCEGEGKKVIVVTTDVLVSISTSIGKSLIRIAV